MVFDFVFLTGFVFLAFGFLGFTVDFVAIYLKMIASLKYQTVYMKKKDVVEKDLNEFF